MMAFLQQHSGVAVLGALLLVFLGFAFGYTKGRRHMRSVRESLDAAPSRSVAPPRLSPDVEARLRDALARRNKIEAIKLLREETGLGLKEAKEYVERMAAPPGRAD